MKIKFLYPFCVALILTSLSGCSEESEELQDTSLRQTEDLTLEMFNDGKFPSIKIQTQALFSCPTSLPAESSFNGNTLSIWLQDELPWDPCFAIYDPQPVGAFFDLTPYLNEKEIALTIHYKGQIVTGKLALQPAREIKLSPNCCIELREELQ